MNYKKLDMEIDELAAVEADAWTRFACQAMFLLKPPTYAIAAESAEIAGEYADAMMVEFRKRFTNA